MMASNNSNFGDYIEFSVEKRFGIITLNRIHRSNAFTIEQLKNLKNAISYCQTSERIRGLILTANGTSFSTGMDLDYIDGSDHTAVKELETTAAQICNLLYNGKPAICAINGRTMGEGVVFLVCCDYKIAVKDSIFQMPEIFSGIFPGTGCSVVFPKIIGIMWTKKMLMLAEKVSAEKALEIGLIDEIVNSREELTKLALEKAKFLSAKNQAVLNAIKLCCNYFFDRPFDLAYPLEKEACFWYKHDDKNEFIKNFRKKFEQNQINTI